MAVCAKKFLERVRRDSRESRCAAETVRHDLRVLYETMLDMQKALPLAETINLIMRVKPHIQIMVEAPEHMKRNLPLSDKGVIAVKKMIRNLQRTYQPPPGSSYHASAREVLADELSMYDGFIYSNTHEAIKERMEYVPNDRITTFLDQQESGGPGPRWINVISRSQDGKIYFNNSAVTWTVRTCNSPRYGNHRVVPTVLGRKEQVDDSTHVRKCFGYKVDMDWAFAVDWSHGIRVLGVIGYVAITKYHNGTCFTAFSDKKDEAIRKATEGAAKRILKMMRRKR